MSFQFHDQGTSSYVAVDDPHGGEPMMIHIIDLDYDGVLVEVRNNQGGIITSDLIQWNQL